ncbi:hypothetical protein DEM27_19865 [Metarhizobium album]|uniref:Uncharacterized protein n=1 Tax=Metarhizobium album TaxID=2182425 RepID=A0A2U2DM30_9HYPH|nr:hypothetical protein [Rhizobium album]PWE54374.1 hypothetical protein DEM27_19865 [Rhizobium album]
MTDTPKDNVTGSPFVASLSADQLRIHEALCDSQFIAGAKAGWNAGCIADPEAATAAFGALIKSRDGHLEGFADAKAALAAQQAPKDNLRVDVDRLAARIVTAACELDGPADPASDDTISITMKDLEAVVHRHVTAAVEGDKL